MGEYTKRWFAAPRWVLTSGLAVLISTLTSVAPARAETFGCEDTWQRIAAWSELEANRGLTTETLEALQVLIPELESCGEGRAGAKSETGDDVERWRDLAAIYFAPDEVDMALCLMAKESGGNADARNSYSGASGLMQVMPSWASVLGYEADDLYDPIVNLWIASQIKELQGWGAWSPYLRGSCR